MGRFNESEHIENLDAELQMSCLQLGAELGGQSPWAPLHLQAWIEGIRGETRLKSSFKWAQNKKEISNKKKEKQQLEVDKWPLT